MELFAQDLSASLEASVNARRQSPIRFVEGLWDKYATPLSTIQQEREQLQASLAGMLGGLGYV